MMTEDPIPHAKRLGPTYQGWECERCGVVDDDDVCVLEDGEAWHVSYGTCGAACHQVDLLVNDPRHWANEGMHRLAALANEVIRLREALATMAEIHITPSQYRKLAKRALRGERITPKR